MIKITNEFYSTIQDVLRDSGVDTADMGFKDIQNGDTAQTQLETWVQSRLIEIKSLIDNERKRNFTQELANGEITEIPPCIHMIARRMGVMVVKNAKINRKSPVIKIDDYTVTILKEIVFTPDILADLKRCAGRKVDMNSIFCRVDTSCDEDVVY